MLFVPSSQNDLPWRGRIFAADLRIGGISNQPGEALIHPRRIAEEQKRVSQLQRQVGPVTIPGTVMPKAAVHEMPPYRFEGQPGRLIDVRAQFHPVVKPAGVKIAKRPDHRRVETANISRAGRDEGFPEPALSLPIQNPPDGIRGCISQGIISAPDFVGFAGSNALRQPGGFPQTRHAPKIVPEMRPILVADMFGAPAAGQQAEWSTVVPNPPRAFENVGSEKTTPEIGRAAQNAVEAPKGPKCLSIAIPLAVVFLMGSAEEPAERNAVGSIEVQIEN